MKNQRLKQFAAGFLIVFSLFVSSVSACTCSRHEEKAETDSSSCHEHSQEKKVESHHDADSPQTVQTLISETECCCVQPARRVFAKSETVKIEKQSLAVLPAFAVKTAFVSQTVSVKSEFVAPFYLTDSFYNLTPGRAPPRR